jgi:hypothetical protein
MPSKHAKPSREWPPYADTLQAPTFTPTVFARWLEIVRNKYKKNEVFQRMGKKEHADTIRRIALMAVAATKQDALFDHFEIESGQEGKWQALALSLAAHHVPGCMPTAPDNEGRPSYNSLLVVEVFLEAKRRREVLKAQGVPTTEASERAMSWVRRKYGKSWTELNEMKFSTLKRRYHEAFEKFAPLPSIGNIQPPPSKRRKK